MTQSLWCWIRILIIFSFPILSCTSTKKSVYFHDQQDGPLPASVTIPVTVISNNDLLGITVTSLNPQATAIFNSQTINYVTGQADRVENIQSYGYLVDADGFIQFPVLGKIRAAGLTEDQFRLFIVKALTDKKLLVDPIVNVRYLNFKVTVLGEVARPTVINVPTQKITLLEALGLAGDITIYGKKNNVMLIRDENGQRSVKRLNLNSSELFTSPYYYLKTNDVVYVEPNKSKIASSGRANQYLPIILSGLSFAAIIIDRLTRKD